jgi:hypothetical protein
MLFFYSRYQLHFFMAASLRRNPFIGIPSGSLTGLTSGADPTNPSPPA